jgi:hypothetical protein
MPIKIVADKTAGRRQHVRSSTAPKGGRKGHPVKRTGKQFGGGFNQPLGGVGARPVGGVGARPVGGVGAPIRPVGFKHGKRVKKK